MTQSLFTDTPPPEKKESLSVRQWAMYVGLPVLVLVGLILPVIFGPGRSRTGPRNSVQVTEEQRREEELTLLQEMIDSIQPGRLGIDSDEATQAEELNRWWLEFGRGSAVEDFGTVHQTSLIALLGPDVAEQALSPTFSRRDVAHLSTALTCRLAGVTVTTGKETELDQLVACFYFTVRGIETTTDASLLADPFPYQSLLFGRGRGEDRMWLLAELLRQMRLDSYVILPVNEAADSTSMSPLLAVPSGGEIWLFDPFLGLPIPSLTDSRETPLPERPASLTEALQNDEVFRQLDGPGQRYPWSSESLKNLRFLVVGSDSTFSPRMELLQSRLPGQYSFIVFDGWESSEFREASLRSRTEQLLSQIEGITATWGSWEFPLQQAIAYGLADGMAFDPLENRYQRLRSPLVRVEEVNDSGQIIVRQVIASRTLQQARALHIQGDWENAMRNYLPIRSAYQVNRISENLTARDLATFWTAMCQLDVGRTDLALQSLVAYLREFPTGQFRESALYWMAVFQVSEGQREDALKTLESAQISAGHRAYLTRRWSSAAVPLMDEPAAEPEMVDLPSESPVPSEESADGTENTALDSAGDNPPGQQSNPDETNETSEPPATGEPAINES